MLSGGQEPLQPPDAGIAARAAAPGAPGLADLRAAASARQSATQPDARAGFPSTCGPAGNASAQAPVGLHPAPRSSGWDPGDREGRGRAAGAEGRVGPVDKRRGAEARVDGLGTAAVGAGSGHGQPSHARPQHLSMSERHKLEELQREEAARRAWLAKNPKR